MSHGAGSPAILFYPSLFLIGPIQFSSTPSFSALLTLSLSVFYFPSQFATSSLFCLSTSFSRLSFIRSLFYGLFTYSKEFSNFFTLKCRYLNRFGALIMIFTGYLGGEQLDVLTAALNQLALSAHLRCLDTWRPLKLLAVIGNDEFLI